MSQINKSEDGKGDSKSPPKSPNQGGIGVFSRFFSFGSLGIKSDVHNTNQDEVQHLPSQIFYGVYIPFESKSMADKDSNDFNTLHIYTDRAEALKIVKKYKKARFKAFNSRQEAVAFALRGAELDRPANVTILGIDYALEGQTIQFSGGEKPSPFRGPRPQEMVQFRKLIESGDLGAVRNMIWENPRYLVSSGDTPSILQEGSRYNALHYAVKSNSIEMCDLLLSTISDPNFMQLLFADENTEHNKERAAVLLDLYLNTPDKAMNETPLHFACKFGFKEIVDLLVSYPQCTRNTTNKFGDQPKDVICSRGKSPNNSTLKNEISAMLKDRFYVPVFHSEDGSQQPIIGEPFSPATPPICEVTKPRDPMSPRVEIRALAGPMEKDEAELFRKRWKTPPRAPRPRPLAEPKFRLQDVHKGLERVGRNLAQKMNIGWKEYWPFLDTFTDLVSDEGLSLLEDYLKNKYISQWNNSSNSVIVSDSLCFTPKSPTEKHVVKSCFNITLQNKHNSTQSENVTLSPMSDLCVALKHCNLEDDSKSHVKFGHSEVKHETKNNDYGKIEYSANFLLNPCLNPYSYIEKSCLVYAKRVSVCLIRALATELDMIFDSLKSELKHLQQTVAAYMDDPRFCTVDFHLIHSRVAQLIAQKLYSDVMDEGEIHSLKQCLNYIAANEKQADKYSSDEDDSANTYRSRIINDLPSEKHDANSHVVCLTHNILKWLTDNRSTEKVSNIQSEDECIKVWGGLYKCHCVWQTEAVMRIHRKNASFKRVNRDKLDTSVSPKNVLDIVSRKLKFDNDEKEVILSSQNVEENNLINKRLKDLQQKSDDNQNENSKTLFGIEEYDSEDEVFLTPVSTPSSEYLSSDEGDYSDADDGDHADAAAIYIFISGEHPSKMDKAVYEAINECDIDRSKYPYVFRWRHTIGLYKQCERDSWPEVINIDEWSDDESEPITPIKGHLQLGLVKTGNLNIQTSTPTKCMLVKSPNVASTPPLQVSKWMRVTGPNTPKAAIKNNKFRPNVSFGF